LSREPEHHKFELAGSYSEDGLELSVFDYRDQPRYIAKLTVGDACARVHLWLSQPDLVAFVAGMARDWRGWDGYRELAGFTLDAASPRLVLRARTGTDEGHVRIGMAAGFPSLMATSGALDEAVRPPTAPGSWTLRGVIEWDAFQFGDAAATQAANLPALSPLG
jgi:hypothetical protein